MLFEPVVGEGASLASHLSMYTILNLNNRLGTHVQTALLVRFVYNIDTYKHLFFQNRKLANG